MTYEREIKTICDPACGTDVIRDLMQPEGQSPFHAIWKVYREWEFSA